MPDFHFPENAAQKAADLAERSSYRPGLILGVSMAATFGIVCNHPLYLVLLVYVALVGGIGAGALTLGAYGFGLSSSLVVAALVPGTRGPLRTADDWLSNRAKALYITQGVAFALMESRGSWFLLRFVVPAT